MMPIESLEKLYKNYNGVTIRDDGMWVSKKFRKFQRYINNMAEDIAHYLNANLVQVNRGYYEGSFFFERDGKYAYVHYGNSLNRTHINFDAKGGAEGFFFCRSAQDKNDYVGGGNIFVTLKELPERLNDLLEYGH